MCKHGSVSHLYVNLLQLGCVHELICSTNAPWWLLRKEIKDNPLAFSKSSSQYFVVFCCSECALRKSPFPVTIDVTGAHTRSSFLLSSPLLSTPPLSCPLLPSPVHSSPLLLSCCSWCSHPLLTPGPFLFYIVKTFCHLQESLKYHFCFIRLRIGLKL